MAEKPARCSLCPHSVVHPTATELKSTHYIGLADDTFHVDWLASKCREVYKIDDSKRSGSMLNTPVSGEVWHEDSITIKCTIKALKLSTLIEFVDVFRAEAATSKAAIWAPQPAAAAAAAAAAAVVVSAGAAPDTKSAASGGNATAAAAAVTAAAATSPAVGAAAATTAVSIPSDVLYETGYDILHADFVVQSVAPGRNRIDGKPSADAYQPVGMAQPPPPPVRMSTQPRASKITVPPPKPAAKPPAPSVVAPPPPAVPIKPSVLSPKATATPTTHATVASTGSAQQVVNSHLGGAAAAAVGAAFNSINKNTAAPKKFGTAPPGAGGISGASGAAPPPQPAQSFAIPETKTTAGAPLSLIASTQGPVRSKRGTSVHSVEARPKVEAKMSFAEHLPHKFEVVSEQAQRGLRVLKRVRSFFQKFIVIQETFSAELKKAVAYEKPKITRETDQMHSSWSGWIKFFDQMEALAAIHSEHAEDMKMQVVEPLNQFHEIGLDQGAASATQVATLEKELGATRVAVSKTRLKLSKELQALQTVKESLENEASGAPASPYGASPASGGGKGLMGAVSGLFGKGSSEQNLDKARARALATATQYQSELEAANRQRQDITKGALPKIMLQMQSLEEMRLHSLNSALQAFVALQDGVTEQFEGVSAGIRELYSNIHSDRDIVQFVEECLSLHGPAADFKPFEYDLSITPDDLQPANFNTKASLFNTTFEGVMRYQQKRAASGTGGDYPADVPRILPALIAAIEREGGCQAEGIFRISASVDDLHILKKQLESGNYDVKCNSPHIPAALLKTWLRDSAEPLIPFAAYGECIALGRELSSGAGATPATTAAMQRIIDALPAINKRIITHLVALMRKISAEDNYAHTRMGPTNLAIVFAPSFLKDKGDDPLTMLQDTKFACAFMTAMIGHWDVSALANSAGSAATITVTPATAASPSAASNGGGNSFAALAVAATAASTPASPHGAPPRQASGFGTSAGTLSPLAPGAAAGSGATFGLSTAHVSGPMNVTTTANLANAKPIQPARPTGVKPTLSSPNSAAATAAAKR